MGDEVGSITLDVRSQACPKYLKQDYNICNISEENVKDEVDLLPTDKCQSFLQRFHYHFSCMARYAQIIQNNKFAISLQYLKKKVSDELDFLPADKHESLLQIDAMILMGIV